MSDKKKEKQDVAETQKLSTKENILQTVKFALFSASAGIIQITTYTLFFEVCHFKEWVAYLISLVLSVLWNFTFNRRYTFRSDASVARSMLLVALFYAVFTPVSTWWGHALTTAGWNDFLVLAITMAVNFVTEFLYQRFVVYRNRIDTNDVARRANEKAEG